MVDKKIRLKKGGRKFMHSFSPAQKQFFGIHVKLAWLSRIGGSPMIRRR